MARFSNIPAPTCLLPHTLIHTHIRARRHACAHLCPAQRERWEPWLKFSPCFASLGGAANDVCPRTDGALPRITHTHTCRFTHTATHLSGMQCGNTPRITKPPSPPPPPQPCPLNGRRSMEMSCRWEEKRLLSPARTDEVREAPC